MPLRYGCAHQWALNDKGDCECNSCQLVLTKERMAQIKKIGLDVQLTNPRRTLLIHQQPEAKFQLFGSQKEINRFVDLLIERKKHE